MMSVSDDVVSERVPARADMASPGSSTKPP